MSGDKPLSDYMTPKEVASHYGVPIGRVYTAISTGRIPSTKTGWGVLVHKKDLPKLWPGRKV